MLHQLPSDQHTLVQPLFKALSDHHLFCAGVISGRYKGVVVVDDPNNPRTAMIFRPGMWCYLGGDAGNQPFVAQLGAALAAKQLIGEQTWALLCSVDSAEWEAALHTLIPNRAPIATPRHLFVGDSKHFNPPPSLPDRYTLHFIDHNLRDLLTGDPPHDVQKVLDLRQGKPDPDRAAFGFVALQNGVCAAWSMIDVIVGTHGDIGLVTDAAHRRRGLASAVSGATIQYGLQNGVTSVHWDVNASNLASIGLANKHELKLTASYNQNLLIFGEVSYLANLAWDHLDKGAYTKTLALCVQLLDIDGGQLYGHFLTGAALAAQGKHTDAFKHLHLSIDHGFDDPFELAMCQPLHALHGRAEWDALSARLPTATV